MNVEAASAVSEPVKEPVVSAGPVPTTRMTLKEAMALLSADILRKRIGCVDQFLAPHEQTFINKYVKINLELGTLAVIVFRFGQWAVRLRNPVMRFVFGSIYWVCNMGIMVLSGINLQAGSNIGRGLVVHNFSCIFIWAPEIGESCTVNQGVTVGNMRGSGGFPRLGNNVYLGSGCKVLGNIKIGNNVVVAANSLVITDVPDNVTVMGVPARVISRHASSTSEYLKFSL